MTSPKVLLVGISGCSSSGKTITANLLPSAILLHEDDFFKHDEEIPFDEKYNVSNWDSPDALDLPLFRKELDHIKKTGEISSKLIHNDNHDSTKTIEVRTETENAIKQKFAAGFHDSDAKIIIVDGFLMYNDPELAAKFDLKILIRAPYATLKKRRAARSGYQTLESFWIDPPFYFDEFVYKTYRECHSQFFEGGNVEGALKKGAGIHDFINDDGTDINTALLWLSELIASLGNL
ncbi:LANO_0E12508g1_1 [Lachancea nothofagi CBS 11611]|uniref:LANO_0E12508g1_1 n=1 Tax=Lachancea nothofagi CBS 11611 TaxID=1266666 RepID=A0A1G4JY56_9SACH|nr:LANO_0E12508g1_1 [Lachancea nothofagi CBS 11611]